MPHRPKAQLHIGMTLAPTWLSGEAWRRPDSGIEGLLELDYYVALARRAEAQHLDFVFRPDTLAMTRAQIDRGVGGAGFDPTLLLAALIQSTRQIGLLTTVSTTFYPPYILARIIQSLHVLSGGRAGWNIVTALEGQQNFSMEAMPAPEERYLRAQEVTDIVQKLWASFPADALLADRGAGRFLDPAQITPIAHRGLYHSVEGPLGVRQVPGARVPLVQAGASEAGRDFAARVADAVFASTPDREAARDLRADLHRRAAAHGRAHAPRLMPGMSLFLAATRAEARELWQETHAATEAARKIATIAEMTGLDLSNWPSDRPIRAADLPPPPAQLRSRTHAALLRRAIIRDEPLLADLLRAPEVIGSAHWQVIGTVEDALVQICEWQDAGAIDGLILFPGGSVGAVDLALEGLIPALVDIGRFRCGYRAQSFIGHLEEGRDAGAT